MEIDRELSAKDEAKLHAFFRLTLFIKGAHAAVELITGAFLFWGGGILLSHVIEVITEGELATDPDDPFANLLLTAVAPLSISGPSFVVFYLISHGLVKGFIAISLLLEKSWAYIPSLAILGLLTIQQTYHLYRHWSFALLLFTLLNLVIMALIWHEYKNLPQHLRK